jgi:hypothetical protein
MVACRCCAMVGLDVGGWIVVEERAASHFVRG